MVLSKKEFIKDIILEQQHNNKFVKKYLTYSR